MGKDKYIPGKTIIPKVASHFGLKGPGPPLQHGIKARPNPLTPLRVNNILQNL